MSMLPRTKMRSMRWLRADSALLTTRGLAAGETRIIVLGVAPRIHKPRLNDSLIGLKGWVLSVTSGGIEITHAHDGQVLVARGLPEFLGLGECHSGIKIGSDRQVGRYEAELPARALYVDGSPAGLIRDGTDRRRYGELCQIRLHVHVREPEGIRRTIGPGKNHVLHGKADLKARALGASASRPARIATAT